MMVLNWAKSLVNNGKMEFALTPTTHHALQSAQLHCKCCWNCKCSIKEKQKETNIKSEIMKDKRPCVSMFVCYVSQNMLYSDIIVQLDLCFSTHPVFGVLAPMARPPSVLHQLKHFLLLTCRVKLGSVRAAKPPCAQLFDTNDICGIMGFYGGAHMRRTNSAAPLNLFKRAICHLLTFRWR